MQDKLRKLEDELDAHDDAHAAGGTRDSRRLTCRDADEAADRKTPKSRTRTKILDRCDMALLDSFIEKMLHLFHCSLLQVSMLHLLLKSTELTRSREYFAQT